MHRVLRIVSVLATLGALWLLGRPAAAPPELPWAPPALRLGVTADLTAYDDQTLHLLLRRLAQLGLTTVRQRFDWQRIEPAPAQFDWAAYDRVTAAASANGIELLALLDGSPAWARAALDSANPLAPPQERADFGRFAARVAQRYSDRISLFQIWDEPNIAPHWGARFVDAADYAGLLREGYVQIKAAAPGSLVLTASLAPTLETGGANLSDIEFLDRLLAAGAGGWFDAVALAPYGFDQPPAAAAAPDRLNYRRAELLHAVLARHGLAAVPLWIAPAGWSAPLTASTTPAAWPAVSEKEQATFTAQALALAQRWPWLHGWLWAGLQPLAPDDPQAGFALRTPDGAERPVVAALAQVAAAPHDVLLPGRHRPSAAPLHYSGDWRFTSLAADPGRTPDAALTFRMAGRRLDLEVQRGPFWAYLVVTVDGQPANALPRDEQGNAVLILHDPLAARLRVTAADHLAPGEHTVTLRPVGGWGQWPLLALTVHEDPSAPAWMRALGWLLLGVGLLAGLATLPLAGHLAAGPQTLAQRLAASSARQTAAAWLEEGALLCLFVIAASLPFFLRPLPILGRPFVIPELCAWLGLALFIAAGLLGRRSPDWRSIIAPAGASRTLDLPVIALLAVGLLSTQLAANFGVASREWRTVFLDAAIFYFLVSRLLCGAQAGRAFWLLVDGLAVGAGAAALIGLGQALFGFDLIRADGVGRVRALYGSPNNLALYLERVLPLLLATAAFGSGRRRRLYGALAALTLTCLILTFSRGALMLGLPAALLALGLLRRGRTLRLALLGLGAGAIGLTAALTLGAARFGDLFDFEAGTSFVRLRLWQGAWNMARTFPWLGVGPDNFLYAYRTRFVLPSAWEELNLSHPHNVLLDFWTRLGLAGVAVGLWLGVRTAQAGLHSARSLASGARRAVVQGLLAGLAAALAHGLVDNSLFLMDLSFFFFACAGVFAALAPPPSQLAA